MAISWAGGNQSLQATISLPPAPWTFATWFERTGNIYNNMDVLASAGIALTDAQFNALQCFWETSSRAISFVPNFASQIAPALTADTTRHCLIATFVNGYITIYVDGVASTPTAWTPSAVTLTLLTIGRTAQPTDEGHCTGYQEHTAIWTEGLDTAARAAYYGLTANPATIGTSPPIAYFPFNNSIADVMGTLTWTPVNLGSPTYVANAITYPAAAPAAVTYNGNGNTGGTAPTDANSPYAGGATVTVLGNTGNLVRTGYTFTGWNLHADGSGTHFNVGDTFLMGGVAVELYADWKLYRHITYHAGEATGGSVPTDTRDYLDGQGASIKMNVNNLVRAGFHLAGWTTVAP